jgi:type IV secretory pathway TraG/TraD family ATPase VirD4
MNNLAHFQGQQLIRQKILFTESSSRCLIKGKDLTGAEYNLPITDEWFSKHLLFIGNIGTGKTNAISQIIREVKSKMTEKDVMIIFDSKGDYYNKFYQENDVIFSNKPENFKGTHRYWNVFKEIDIDESYESKVENSLEIASTLFADKIKKTQQPFFPNAAKDILSALLQIFTTEFDSTNNASFFQKIVKESDAQELRNLFEEFDFKSLISYISSDDSPQTGGVLAELYQLLNEIFVGAFCKNGDLSIKELVRQKGGKTVFIEYDPSAGSLLTPIYRLLLDLAIKEAIGRQKTEGNVWFIIDEFPLVPNLKHIDNGINFGRSQGCKFIIGLQNIPQAYHEYGESLAQSLLSGLNTVFSFRVDDSKSRDFIQNRYGNSLKKLSYTNKGILHEVVGQHKVIEDWDISNLEIGTAIIGLPSRDPFIFKFNPE